MSLNPPAGNAAMRAPPGQHALRNGVGRDVWFAAAGGRPVNDGDVSLFVRQKIEGAVLMRDYPAKESPSYAALTKLKAQMDEQEAKLVSRFLKP